MASDGFRKTCDQMLHGARAGRFIARPAQAAFKAPAGMPISRHCRRTVGAPPLIPTRVKLRMSFANNPAVNSVFWPGLKLTRALRLPATTALMAIVPVAPLTWLTTQALLASHRDLESTRVEYAGSPLIGPTLDVVSQTQKHRGLVNLWPAGDTHAAGALAPNRAALNAATAALQSTVLRHPEFELGATWQPIREVLDRLADGQVPADAGQSFRLHSEQVEALRRFLSCSAEASGLLLDPEAAPFHLMHLAVEPLVVWTEAVGQLRGRGAA